MRYLGPTPSEHPKRNLLNRYTSQFSYLQAWIVEFLDWFQPVGVTRPHSQFYQRG